MLFIIDVWLWALLGFATWFSLRREKRGGEWRTPAQVALAASLLYILANGVWSSLVRVAEGASLAESIASPVPLAFWDREVIGYVQPGEYWIDDHRVGECSLDAVVGGSANAQAIAFLFWSRAPFAERAADGSIILRDARFYDPRARDRFSVALPDVRCEPL